MKECLEQFAFASLSSILAVTLGTNFLVGGSMCGTLVVARIPGT